MLLLMLLARHDIMPPPALLPLFCLLPPLIHDELSIHTNRISIHMNKNRIAETEYTHIAAIFLSYAGAALIFFAAACRFDAVAFIFVLLLLFFAIVTLEHCRRAAHTTALYTTYAPSCF